jgi:hypothetical protein
VCVYLVVGRQGLFTDAVGGDSITVVYKDSKKMGLIHKCGKRMGLIHKYGIKGWV